VKSIVFIIVVFLAASCKYEKDQTRKHNENLYARDFSIESHDNYKTLNIYDPWQKAKGAFFQYVISDSKENIPDSLKNYKYIPVKPQKVIVFSTTHIGFISEINCSNTICGASGVKYIYNDSIRRRIDSGEIIDIGHAPNIDYEKIVEMQPNLVFVYGLGSSVMNIIKRLDEAGIPSVVIGEFLEKDPLAKMEWIKIFASIYNKEEYANTKFKEACDNYNYWKNKVSELNSKPKVLIGLPWKDTWFLSGGQSFQASFIKDAGGDYLWKENESKDFIAADLESVFLKALEADVWINPGNAGSLDHIFGMDQRFSNIKAFKENMVYNSIKRINKNGGNDYWESGAVHPDLILMDLIKIFHPELLKEQDFVYYRKLK